MLFLFPLGKIEAIIFYVRHILLRIDEIKNHGVFSLCLLSFFPTISIIGFHVWIHFLVVINAFIRVVFGSHLFIHRGYVFSQPLFINNILGERDNFVSGEYSGLLPRLLRRLHLKNWLKRLLLRRMLISRNRGRWVWRRRHNNIVLFFRGLILN